MTEFAQLVAIAVHWSARHLLHLLGAAVVTGVAAAVICITIDEWKAHRSNRT